MSQDPHIKVSPSHNRFCAPPVFGSVLQLYHAAGLVIQHSASFPPEKQATLCRLFGHRRSALISALWRCDEGRRVGAGLQTLSPTNSGMEEERGALKAYQSAPMGDRFVALERLRKIYAHLRNLMVGGTIGLEYIREERARLLTEVLESESFEDFLTGDGDGGITLKIPVSGCDPGECDLPSAINLEIPSSQGSCPGRVALFDRSSPLFYMPIDELVLIQDVVLSSEFLEASDLIRSGKGFGPTHLLESNLGLLPSDFDSYAQVLAAYHTGHTHILCRVSGKTVFPSDQKRSAIGQLKIVESLEDPKEAATIRKIEGSSDGLHWSLTMTLSETIHTRPAALVIRLLEGSRLAHLTVKKKGAAARSFSTPASITALVTMGLGKGDVVEWEACGDQAESLIRSLKFYNDHAWLPPAKGATLYRLPVRNIRYVEKHLLEVMDSLGVDTVSAVYDPVTSTLILGDPHQVAHQTMAESIGLSILDVTRVVIERTGGTLRASFFSLYDGVFDNVASRVELKRLLSKWFE